MGQYHAIFSRYVNGTRVQCAPIAFLAESFDAACAYASGILRGMRAADSHSDYEIAEVRRVGLGGKWATEGWGSV